MDAELIRQTLLDDCATLAFNSTLVCQQLDVKYRQNDFCEEDSYEDGDEEDDEDEEDETDEEDDRINELLSKDPEFVQAFSDYWHFTNFAKKINLAKIRTSLNPCDFKNLSAKPEGFTSDVIYVVEKINIVVLVSKFEALRLKSVFEDTSADYTVSVFFKVDAQETLDQKITYKPLPYQCHVKYCQKKYSAQVEQIFLTDSPMPTLDFSIVHENDSVSDYLKMGMAIASINLTKM